MGAAAGFRVWFTLDHNGASAQVQYAWHSRRKQLHLFAAIDGSCYLIQLRRGVLAEPVCWCRKMMKALTVRATRDALAKLDANLSACSTGCQARQALKAPTSQACHGPANSYSSRRACRWRCPCPCALARRQAHRIPAQGA